jgi:hypothetical protein
LATGFEKGQQPFDEAGVVFQVTVEFGLAILESPEESSVSFQFAENKLSVPAG